MADIAPFVATRYALTRSQELARVLTPPYDVITPAMQQAFYDADPHNIVRIDFGKTMPDDNEFENRYARAGALWHQWRDEKVVVEDPKKCFHVYEQEFELPDGRTVRRRGFYAAVRLQDFSEGGIRAHEHTFDGPKADRFRLMRATNANLSPIFCLYDDPSRQVDELLAQATASKAIETRFDGVVQRLWPLCKSSVVARITERMKDQTLFIADGHHRYETSLLFRDEMREITGRRDGRQPFDYTMMYLNNIHDEGLVVLPTHRILSKEAVLGVNLQETLDDLAEHFEVEPLALNGGDVENEARRCVEQLSGADASGTAFVMLLPKGRSYLLKLKPQTDLDELIDDEKIARQIKSLDVTILHRYIINQAWLGNPEIELDDEDVRYEKDAAAVLKAMSTCKWGVGFLLNPTRIEQVCEVARAGLRMPHKSTYFYPKLVTGLVMRDLNSPW
ncbi:MAG TPA: DUF1015 domain-containing protein [Candidatus Sumerlaeota bacterium]|nr:DUF1015 domain-containing protein [Candidatus Sumerlaeota bacterium]HOR26736.1 DUF1015 domain-containing protein [Candidatus Sumerlaeota bacterium]